MRILVDADACPVKDEIVNIAGNFNLEIKMYIDSSHELISSLYEVITVDKGIDAVDLKILKDLKKGDIVVTQDFGLASLVLSKEAFAINQNGLVFTENNINKLLFERYLSAESRRKGLRSKNMGKRDKKMDLLFRENLNKLIEENI